jgi:FHS family glucose/mannose:H+ symporter-like MFS transporter
MRGETIVESKAQIEAETGRRGRNGLLATGFVLNLLYAMYISGLGVLLPVLGQTFHLGIEVKARLFPASFMGAVVGVLLTGSLSDRYGRKPVLLFSLALYTLGLLRCGAAASFGLALLAAPLIGAGSAGMQSVMNAALSDLFPERRAIVLNSMQVAFGVGAIVSPTLAQQLLQAGTDWRLLYFGLAAGVACASVALALLPMPRPADGAKAPGLAALFSLLANPFVVVLCVAQLLYAGAEVGFFSWMPTYFQEHVPGGTRWAGVIVSLFWVGMTTGRLCTGWLLSRFALVPLRRSLATGGALCATLTLVGTAPFTVMCWVLLTGLCFGGIYSVILAEGSERFPSVAGTVLGAISAAGNIGVALFPWAIGALVNKGVDWRLALSLPPLCAAGVALNALFLEIVRNRRQAMAAGKL